VRGLEKGKFVGKAMQGMRQHVPSLAGLSEASRCFANHDHKTLVRAAFPTASVYIEKLDSGGDAQLAGAMMAGDQWRAHLLSWMQYLSGAA